MPEQESYRCPNCQIRFRIGNPSTRVMTDAGIYATGKGTTFCRHLKRDGQVCMQPYWERSTKTSEPILVGIHPDDLPREAAA